MLKRDCCVSLTRAEGFSAAREDKPRCTSIKNVCRKFPVSQTACSCQNTARNPLDTKSTIHEEFCCRFLRLGGTFCESAPQFGAAPMDTNHFHRAKFPATHYFGIKSANDRHRCDRFSKSGAERQLLEIRMCGELDIKVLRVFTLGIRARVSKIYRLEPILRGIETLVTQPHGKLR